MLSNYYKLALRNLLKNKTFSALNIVGLAVGMACCLLIILYVRRERSMDTFHTAANQIYKVLLHVQMAEDMLKMASLPPAFAPRIVSEISGVEAFVRVYDTGEMSVRSTPEQVFYEEGIYADTAFFDLFTFPILSGNGAKQALSRPGNIVISQKMAEKFFPGQDPVGQLLTMDAKRPFTVAAVMRNVPDHSHLQFDFVLPWSALLAVQPDSDDENWGWAGSTTFLKLAAGKDPQVVENQLPDLLKRHLHDQRATRFSLHLQGLPEVYFGSGDYRNVLAKSLGEVKYLHLFSWLAAIILAIACVNFMNLSTARATERAREVGMRKSLGAGKSQLVGQFLSEGMVMAGLAFLLALGLASAAAPFSGPLFGVPLRINFLQDPSLALIFLGIAVGTGLLAGFYPAFVLSAFQPVEILKNTFRQKTGGIWLRKGLVILQFAATVVLMVASMVIFQQMRFLQSQNPGFDKEQVIVLPLQGNGMQDKAPRLRQLLENTPAAVSVCLSSNAFDGNASSSTVLPEGAGEGGGWQTVFYSVDDHWLRTTGIRLVAGRFFSPAFTADTATHLGSVLVNETAARSYGWGTPEQCLGKRIAANRDTAVVVGVVSDFNFASLHTAVEPIILYKLPGEFANAMVRLQPGDPTAALAAMKNTWQQVFPDYPFEYFFLDEHLADLYQTEQRVARLSSVATGLAIAVACLGLFGLALFTVQRKSKEIGIRKVLGASVAGISGLLAKDFLALVLVAIVIATPIAYYFMQQWLADFAYRIELQWWMFALAGLAAVLIAFLTVGFQSVKAALANPVQSLRSE